MILTKKKIITWVSHKYLIFSDGVIFRTLFNKGSRVPIRGKVNEALTTGLRVVDTILPIGRGQRQVMIGKDKEILVLGFKLIAGAIASCAFIGVAIGVGLV